MAWFSALLPEGFRVPHAWFRASYDLLEGTDDSVARKYLAG